MKINSLKLTKTAVLVAALFGLLATPAARANLSLRTYSANYVRNFSNNGQYGDLICSFDQYGNHQGDLANSYNCSYNHTSINYCGGDYASQGTCLVLKDWWGGAYVWNICNWNGQDQIDCHIWRYFGCYDIEVYGHCQTDCNPPPCDQPPCNPPPATCVPEPTTFVAGALLLVPFGVEGIRQMRRRKLPA